MMKSYREFINTLIDYLKINLPNINIAFAKYGEIPAITPAILIYAEPFQDKISSLGKAKVRTGKLTIFALNGGEENIEDAIFSSFELLETVEDLIYEFDRQNDGSITMNENPISFDDVYSNIAVSYLEFLFFYKKHNE